MALFTKFVPAAKRADKLLDATASHLVTALETAKIAHAHAVKAEDHHQAQIEYHSTKLSTAASLRDEASGTVEVLNGLVGDDEENTTT